FLRRSAKNGAEQYARILVRGDSSAAGLHHFLSVLEEFRDVEAHDRRGNHPEIGQRGIASANAGHAEENVPELVGFGDLLHFGAGIGNSDEAVAGFLRTNLLLDLLEKILLVDIGLKRAPGFAGDDANRALEIDSGLDGFDLRGVRGIQHVQRGKALDLPESHAQNFRAKAGAAHAQQQRMLELGLLYVRRNFFEDVELRKLLFGDVQPA